MKIAFLLHNAYGIGGTIRTTMNLATALADRHEVEIVSMMRHRETPRFALDPRVRLVPLVDTRPESADAKNPLFFEASRDFPATEKRIKQYNRLMDTRAAEYLRGCDADVIVGTRPGVNVYISRFAPRRALRIAQEHLRYEAHSKRLRAELAPFYRALDAVVTTTEADAAVYRKKMPMPGVRTLAIPNSVPEPGVAPSAGTEPVIAAAGRLVRGKRFDLLIDAFAEISVKFPAWRLRIYGGGAEKERLAEHIERLGLSGSAELMGSRSPIEAEFAKASLVAVASDAESFGMTIVEAMRCGVPVVSTDCPLGPAEIIKDGVTGRLVPTGDKHALASALMELMGDAPARRAMGADALEGSRIYDPEPIARRYDQLFEELRASRSARLWDRYRSAARARLRRLARRFGLSPARRTPAAGHKASA
ncbi:glycosyltransferase family 4 protein [Streptomyces iranensis]|uniref:D-inositol 3-phosphate glycosyltransferase n=1 Tax=Streptomyces iranensis TaxID=576784 RepID=A0A060ZEQ7_9ACTN|nr:glycosyltransferase family 4 protein [Streptomyces iranensis]MBP2062022.1 glycosyltransferase involved in cell wall biosynthesis [Streptomyces iranensis]CDR03959.1 glycosyl transferase group 1 [Streptomyces iranensis]